MTTRFQALTGSFHANQARALVWDVGVEDTHGIAATAHAGHHRIGLAALVEVGHLVQALFADDALEVAHHHRVGVWAGHGTDDVERVFDVGHPVAQRLVERVLQGATATFHRHHGGTQQLHAVDVGALALHVLAAHVHHAFQAVAGANGGRGHTVLARAGLGDHAWLAHAARQHGLTDGVVDLVRAGVVEVLALEVDLGAAHLSAHAGRVVDGGGTPDEVGQFAAELGHEFGVVAVVFVGRAQLVDGVGQRFADEAAAIGAEVAVGVGLLVGGHGEFRKWVKAGGSKGWQGSG